MLGAVVLVGGFVVVVEAGAVVLVVVEAGALVVVLSWGAEWLRRLWLMFLYCNQVMP